MEVKPQANYRESARTGTEVGSVLRVQLRNLTFERALRLPAAPQTCIFGACQYTTSRFTLPAVLSTAPLGRK